MPSPLGRHMPLDARPLRALQTAHDIGCDAIQIFVSSPRTWAPPAANATETAALVKGLQEQGFRAVVIHAAYLINCASANPQTRTKSKHLLQWTLERGAAIGATDVVFHIGSHGGDGMVIGVERLIEAIQEIGQVLFAEDVPDPAHDAVRGMPRLLLENDVGAGNTIGSDFGAMAQVLAAVQGIWGDRIGVCIDTAHLWGAGYDIGTADAAELTLRKMDSTFGLGQIRVIHLNDTVTVLGGHRDLHARLGEGIIGADGICTLLTDPRLPQPAIILETPINQLADSADHDWEAERQQIQYVRGIAKLE